MKTELWKCSRSGCYWVGTEEQKKGILDTIIAKRDFCCVTLFVCPCCGNDSFYAVGKGWRKLRGDWKYRLDGKLVELKKGSASLGICTVEDFLSWAQNPRYGLVKEMPRWRVDYRGAKGQQGYDLRYAVDETELRANWVPGVLGLQIVTVTRLHGGVIDVPPKQPA